MSSRLASLALVSLLTFGPAMPVAASNAQWAALTPAQRQVLAPLERDWSEIDSQGKSKWLELAARFPGLPAEERSRLQQRMAEWSRMSPAERSRARLQFQETRQLQPTDRQAQWQAYQALSEEQRRSLAQRAKPASKPNAKADVKADSSAGKRNLVQTTARQPTRAATSTVQQAKPGATTLPMNAKAALPPAHHQAGLPKIAATPGFVDPATLLPKRGPQGAAARAAPSSDPKKQP
jgi:Protein of unknown function (DUF3106)